MKNEKKIDLKKNYGFMKHTKQNKATNTNQNQNQTTLIKDNNLRKYG